MLYPLPHPGPRGGPLARAARELGWRILREDPCAFAALIERTISDNPRWYIPRATPEELSVEEVRAHTCRLETLIDDAVELALDLYNGKRRDLALLSIAMQAERLMHRIWSDPWKHGTQVIEALGRRHRHKAQDKLRSLRLVKSSHADKDP